MYKKFKSLNNETKYITFYLLSVLLIGFFMWDIVSVTQELGEREINIKENDKLVSINEYYSKTEVINMDQTVSGVIRAVAFNLIQVIFIVMFMLCLYIHQSIREYGTK